MTSNDVSSKVWSSENNEDRAELILKRILYGFELKIHYAMDTIMISFILLGLLILLLVGMYEKYNFFHVFINKMVRDLNFFRSWHLMQYCSREDCKI